MTESENKARKKIINLYNECYIKKIPDYKTTYCTSGGLPDYVVIVNGYTIWYEIKNLDKNKKSLSFNAFTNQQCKEFVLMSKEDAIINIWITYGKEDFCIEWNKIYKFFLEGKRKSIPVKLLKEWDIKNGTRRSFRNNRKL